QQILAAPHLEVSIKRGTPHPRRGKIALHRTTVKNEGKGPVPSGQPITATITLPDGFTDVKASGGSAWKITVDSSSGKVVATYTGPYPIAPGQELPPIEVGGTPSKTEKQVSAKASVSTPNDSSP